MSPWVLLPIAVVVPPLGIVLLWTRTRARFLRKLLGSFALVLLSFVHLHYFFGLRAELDGTGARPIFSFEAPESHYEALERSRTEQGVAAEVAPPVDEVAPPPAGRDWPRFRGPRMDGRYETEIATEWPSGGPRLLWKQAVGGGYASFVIAEGRAFTHRTAARSGGRGRLRSDDGSGDMDLRVDDGVSRDVGRRWPEGDADSR